MGAEFLSLNPPREYWFGNGERNSNGLGTLFG
jgi:hypothetical protein